MIKFHPSPEQLASFAEGSLSPAESLMVSAHCDMCSKCNLRVASEVEYAALEIDTPAASTHTEDQIYQSMFASITQLPADKAITSSPHPSSNTIELDGRVFELPRTLSRYVNAMGNWTSLVGRLWQAPVDLGNCGVAHFIYMGKGGSVPEHTHRGSEFTLVVNGEFGDGINAYDTGDFIYMDGEHTHAPHSDAAEGCLVFSIVDQPLHFTSGIARLLNPFSHLFFR